VAPRYHTAPPESLSFNRSTDSEEEDFGHQRGKGVLLRLTDKNPDLEESLRQAHDLLANHPRYAAAMHAAARSLRDGCIRVFISYRSGKDAPAARAIAEALRQLSGDEPPHERMKVTLADEFAMRISGRDFKDEIATKIAAADWFILLAPDPKTPSDWCMFETGMFRSTMVPDVHRLIPICHPSAQLPDPISEFQAHEANEAGLYKLFRGLFQEPNCLPGWPPLNRELDESTLRGAARQVSELFSAPSREVPLTPWVRMTIPDSVQLTDPTDLARLPIETDQRTADYFGRASPPTLWGELVGSLDERGRNGWLAELTPVLAKARDNRRIRPIAGTFESDVSGRVLRPVVQSIDASGPDARFTILFVEDFATAPDYGLPRQTLALLTAVRMNNRIRWEVVERFRNVTWDESLVAECQNVFSRIEREIGYFGQWDVDLLCRNFSEAAAQDVRRMVNRWCELRAAGISGREHLSGELDVAFKEGDADRISSLFSEMAELNQRFLSMANPSLEALLEPGGGQAGA
jgi:hypothetical protein